MKDLVGHEMLRKFSCSVKQDEKQLFKERIFLVSGNGSSEENIDSWSEISLNYAPRSFLTDEHDWPRNQLVYETPFTFAEYRTSYKH